MLQIEDKLAGLIGSRICHDLISPIGAVTNGLELMELAGAPAGPEVDLITQSAQHASARLRYLRLAFGTGHQGQDANGHAVGSHEIQDILNAVFSSERLTVAWLGSGSHARGDVKAVFLALMCVETGLNGRGSIEISEVSGRWTLVATGPHPDLNTTHWHGLRGQVADDDIAPSAVQFALLPHVLSKLGRTLDITAREGGFDLSF